MPNARRTQRLSAALRNIWIHVSVAVSMVLSVVYFASVSGVVDFGDKTPLVKDFLPWAVGLPAVTLAICAWRRKLRRHRLVVAGCCPCGYNRAGLAAGAVCPECGAPAPPAASDLP